MSNEILNPAKGYAALADEHISNSPQMARAHINGLIKIIEALQAKEASSQWVSVEDQPFPEEEGWYLTYSPSCQYEKISYGHYEKEKTLVDEGDPNWNPIFCEEGFYSDEGLGPYDDVTHWCKSLPP